MLKLGIRIGSSLAGLLLVPALLGAQAADSGDALRRAAGAGDVAKVRELLAAGVDVNAANSYGGTALAFACDKGRIEVVKVLLEHGAEIEVQDRFYQSKPLAWAVIKDHADIARLLLEHGAQGEADALSTAVATGSKAVVQLIVGRGKLTPEQLGEALRTARLEEDKKEIAGILEAAGAKVVAALAVDPAVLAACAGAYEGPAPNPPLTLAVQEGKLAVVPERGNGFPLEAIALEPLTFRAAQFGGFRVIIKKEGDAVTGFDLDQGGSITHFRKTSGGKP